MGSDEIWMGMGFNFQGPRAQGRVPPHEQEHMDEYMETFPTSLTDYRLIDNSRQL